jgi:hypothetical protein
LLISEHISSLLKAILASPSLATAFARRSASSFPVTPTWTLIQDILIF